MTFKLTQSPTFRQPVQLHLRGEDGKVVEIEFTGIFRRREQTEIDSYVERNVDNDTIARENMTGWENGPDGDDGKPLAFSAENLDLVTSKIHGMRVAISQAFFEGNNAATRKN